MRREDALSKSVGNQSGNYRIGFNAFAGKPHKALSRTDLWQRGGNKLFMMRGFEREVEELKRPDHPENVIYLDGAAKGPFVDARRGIISADHHQGCIRQITLATCEQIWRFARKQGIQATGYTVVGNLPDLDTVLGGWAAMHADRVAFDDHMFSKMCPLISVAGIRDALGPGYEELAGFPKNVIEEVHRKIAWFRKEEVDLQSQDRWNVTDFIDFVERSFSKIDEYAFFHEESEEIVVIENEQTFTLSNGDTVIFARAPEGGVFGVENELVNKKKNGNCVCIIYHDGKAKWTIKAVGIAPKYKLGSVWARLSSEERAAKSQKGITDEGILKINWNGGDDIGGQPRYEHGTSPFMREEAIVPLVLEELEKQLYRRPV